MRAAYDEFHAVSSMPGLNLRPENWSSPADWPAEWTQVFYKRYPRAERVELSERTALPPMDLADALAARRSARDPGTTAVTAANTVAVLAASVGVRHDLAPSDVGARRAYPSGGARFPVEIYLRFHHVADIADGLYHYNIVEDDLRVLSRSAEDEPVFQHIFGFDWITGARATVLMTAAFNRSAMKYGERAYRFALLEAGHLAQNILLTSAALGLAATPVGGFSDYVGDVYLELEYTDEHLLYAVVLP
ncbi:SagB/ThcOx family dehydrogenase [Dactylosporangium sp. CA-139114]|uniref:SagB/ThcOx family dehydrogenase n=1 Tax=Dactylosporangium sp. CA-139114 TaxID=3239931 RepID=UPI003D97C0DC